MPLPAFTRAGLAALAKLGQDAMLNGVSCGRVHVARGVKVQMEDTVVERNVATIGGSYSPRVGMALAHPDGNYVLDALLNDNGVNRRFILR